MRVNKDEKVIQRPVLGIIAQVSDTIQFKPVQFGWASLPHRPEETCPPTS